MRVPVMTTLSPSATLETPSMLDVARAAARPKPAATTRRPFSHSFATEWFALVAALVVIGVLIAYALFKARQSVDATERDRLQVQARVVDDNVGQQLDGINRALASVRDEFLATPKYSISSLLSLRLKALSDAIPGVRSMVLLDADGNVAATSVDTLLGRDFSSRDFFVAAKASSSPATLHVAVPYKTSLGNYTVVFARAIIGANGAFEGVAAAALEPEYFQVLMRSVLYAPDMWVSLGHNDGKVFVTMPVDATRVDSDWQAATAALAAAPSTPTATPIVIGAIGGSGVPRMTALRYLSPPDLHMDKPLVIAVSRAMPDVFRAWRHQAIEYAVFYVLLCAAACVGLYRGQWRRNAFASLEARVARERRQSAEQLELALQGAELGLWDWELHDDHFNHNDVTLRQLGYARGEIGAFGDDWQRLIHAADASRMLAATEAHLRGETPAYECEYRVRHKNGHWVWLLSRGKVVERDEFGIAVRMAGTHMDLSRRKRAEADLERTAEMLRRTGELAHIGGWELDLATMRVDWTEQVYRIHEVEPGTMPSLEDAVDFFAPQAQPAIRAAIENAAEFGTPYDIELPFITAKGNQRWVRAQGLAVLEDGKPVRLLGAFHDITERKTIALEMHRLNEQLTRLSTTNSLTEVGNRRLFDHTLKTEWARASRRNESVGLLMIDIDHFKEYNDHYGHPAGDACLRQVARMVGDAVRRGGELLARYGGEEFALLLPGADLDEARRAAERCFQIVADAKIEHRASTTSAWVTISIGVASQPAAAGVGCSVLVEIADAALYRAKRCGRGRIEY
jgi:diguanylate cyclase (GGDEF)-like protein/PAS domain S-box-containing protein